MSIKYDVLIVGSGPAGAQAADVCVKNGLRTVMIDGGVVNEHDMFVPDKDFEWIRSHWDSQHELFLGKELDGIIPSGKDSHSGSMMSGARKHVAHKTDLLPVQAPGLEISQTLAKGGLSEAWGAVSGILNKQELASIGITDPKMKQYYQEAIDLAGFSGAHKDYRLMPKTSMDANARMILNTYQKQYPRGSSSFIVEQPLLALLTQKKGKRLPVTYNDMNYWSNTNNSVYRSRFTIEDLQKNKLFTYLPRQVAIEFTQDRREIVLRTRTFESVEQNFRARTLILAAGAINTSKIVLKSARLYDQQLRILIKEHVLIPALNLAMLGRKDLKKHSLCQLTLESTSTKAGQSRSFSQLYSYKSLLLFKLLSYSPLPAPQSLALAALYTPSLVLVDVRFPSFIEDSAWLALTRSNGKDYVRIHYDRTPKKNKDEIKCVKTFLRSVGLVPLGVTRTSPGSAAHYAGGIPFDNNVNLSELHTLPDGQLSNYNCVYIADASTWRVLPAKPPTLTIMANARRVAYNAVLGLKKKL